MFNTYHLINKEPFLNRPSAKVFFKSSNHASAWDFLLENIDSQEPAVMVSGNYGVGKTVLCLKLIEQLEQQQVPHVYVSTPMQSYREVLLGICGALKIKRIAASADEDDLHRAIYKYLDNNPEANVVIIVDDAQEHNSKNLNKIRLLANYTQGGHYFFRLFFFGSPAFQQRLRAVDMEPLDQRIKRRYELKGLDFEDAKEYIYFRLINAGAKGSPFFSDQAVEVIVDSTEGVLRKMNNLCDMCLQIGASKGLEDLDAELVREAITALGWEDAPLIAESDDKSGDGADAVESAPVAAPLQPSVQDPVQAADAGYAATDVAAEEESATTGFKLHSDVYSAPPHQQQSPQYQHPSSAPPAPASEPPVLQPMTPPPVAHPPANGYYPANSNAPTAYQQPPAQPDNDAVQEGTQPQSETVWTSWLFRGVVVFLLMAIFATIVAKDLNIGG
ncbi:AAA family ATPase [Bacterioplanoides sp.]|uniref:ExeA family protein n=1 Tax=Bacterioplanoides sp. TaxID=2066072 RepID=UPI003B00ACB0